MPPSTTASRGIPCSRRPGSPKPTRSRTRISGRPRKMSTYAVAAARSGKNTGPRAVLATARPSATTTMITADPAITRRLSQSPSATFGREDSATSTSKKDCRTRGQPGELVRTTTAIAVTTRVLTRATAVDRAACRRRNAGRQLADQDGVRELGGGDVQRGRQVDDDRVDQTGGQCLLDVVVVVEQLDVCGRGDRVLADLRIGAMVGTTSAQVAEDTIAPTTDVQLFNDNDQVQ